MASATAFHMPVLPFRDHGLMGALVGSLVLTAGLLLGFSFAWIPWAALVLGVGVGVVRARLIGKTSATMERETVVPLSVHKDPWFWAGIGAIILLHTLAFSFLLRARTDAAIASPWQSLPTTILPVFGLGFFLLLLLGAGARKRLVDILWIVQSALAFGVSTIVYRLGFGFDPFIHQAAARALVERSRIDLTSILYAGQYAFEAGLARMTGLPVAWIDRALVPLLAVVIVGWLAPRVVRAWGIEHPFVGSRVLFLLPFLPLTFTVPYQLTYLGLVFVILLLPWLVVRAGFVCAALFLLLMGLVHPLLAIPAGILVVCGWLGGRVPRLAGLGAFLLTFIGLLAAFYVYVTRLGGTMALPTTAFWQVAWQTLTAFPYRLTDAPWIVEVFYRFFHVWPFLFALVGCIGMRFLPPSLRPFRWIYPGAAFGLLSVAFVLAASTRFVDILSTEQFEFALRLRYAFPLFFLPGVIAGIERFLVRIPHALRPFIFLLCAALATGAWYVSYPQANRYIQMSAPGMSKTDIQTVQAIEAMAAGQSYVALTPQMVSAAALDQLGFGRELQTPQGKRYAYAIPTGGEFYQQYLRLWHEPDIKRILSTTRALSGQQRVFIVIPRAWDPRGVLGARLLPLVSAHERVDGRADVYFFER